MGTNLVPGRSRDREAVQADLERKKGEVEAAYAAVKSAEALHEMVRREAATLGDELRALEFAPNATVTHDVFEPFSMNDEEVHYRLRKGERVQASRSPQRVAVTRADGRTFEVYSGFVEFDAGDQEPDR
jgi:hypothetical protein